MAISYIRAASQLGIAWLLFIESFLKNRKFVVRVNAERSTERILENVVPQGSVLSTTLFLIAINCVVEKPPSTIKAVLYVDDLTILHTYYILTSQMLPYTSSSRR